ncbi:hypothetical protein [Azospirillum sp. sgz301742]
MAQILSFHDAQRRQTQAIQHAADRAEALSYVERMTAFHAEMQRLTARFDILGDAETHAEAELFFHPAMLRA